MFTASWCSLHCLVTDDYGQRVSLLRSAKHGSIEFAGRPEAAAGITSAGLTGAVRVSLDAILSPSALVKMITIRISSQDRGEKCGKRQQRCERLAGSVKPRTADCSADSVGFPEHRSRRPFRFRSCRRRGSDSGRQIGERKSSVVSVMQVAVPVCSLRGTAADVAGLN